MGGTGGENDKDVQRLSPEQLARIGHLYRKRKTPDDAKEQVFAGEFTDRTPADVGGAGFYTHFTSPLGSCLLLCRTLFGRRRPGIATRPTPPGRGTGDRPGRRLAGAELGRDPNFPRLKKFLDEDFRRDLKNLGVYEFTGRVTEDCQKKSNGDFLVRAGLYLCERGYFSPKEVPMLVRAVAGEMCAPAGAHAAAVGEKNGRRRRATAPRLAGVPWRSTETEGLDGVRPSTDLFRKRLAQWKTEINRNPKAQEPTPGDVARSLFPGVIGFHLVFGDGDSPEVKEVKLFCGQKP